MNIQNSDYTLTKMVGIYERPLKSERVSDDLGQHFYLETFPALHTDSGVKLGAGAPITKRDFDDMINYFSARQKEKQQESILVGDPRHLLFCDQHLMHQDYLWLVPAGEKDLLFSKDCGVKDGKMIIPNLIFHAKGTHSLTVVAIRDKELSEKSVLYHAPFLNVYQNGNVCLGTASRNMVTRSKTFMDFTQSWENVFFGSKFSHGVADHLPNLKKLTAAAIKSKTAFPEKELKPYKAGKEGKEMTWGEQIKGLAKAINRSTGLELPDEDDFDDN